MEILETILFTEAEIETQLELLEEEIEDLEAHKKIDPSKNIKLPMGTLNRMITSRKDKEKSLANQNLIIERDNNTLDLKELTFSECSGVHGLIFLTGRLATGHFIGFWSHSPWSTTENQEKGWAIIDPEKMEIIDTCETRSSGNWCGDFRAWRKKIKGQFGKMTILHDGMDTNKPVWRMSEC